MSAQTLESIFLYLIFNSKVILHAQNITGEFDAELFIK